MGTDWQWLCKIVSMNANMFPSLYSTLCLEMRIVGRHSLISLSGAGGLVWFHARDSFAGTALTESLGQQSSEISSKDHATACWVVESKR